MTAPNTITLKAIAAILEAIDPEDGKDAALALTMIRTLLSTTEGARS